MRRQQHSFWSFRGAEKLFYIVGIPMMVSYGGYLVYKKEVAAATERAERLKATENKYLSSNLNNLIKLENFTKKVYAVGIVDDILDDPEHAKKQPDAWKIRIAENAALIRNLVSELQAENVVLEMCEERYEEEVYEILSHPNFDRTF